MDVRHLKTGKTMKTKEQIEAEIAELQAQLARLEGKYAVGDRVYAISMNAMCNSDGKNILITPFVKIEEGMDEAKDYLTCHGYFSEIMLHPDRKQLLINVRKLLNDSLDRLEQEEE